MRLQYAIFVLIWKSAATCIHLVRQRSHPLTRAASSLSLIVLLIWNFDRECWYGMLIWNVETLCWCFSSWDKSTKEKKQQCYRGSRSPWQRLFRIVWRSLGKQSNSVCVCVFLSVSASASVCVCLCVQGFVWTSYQANARLWLTCGWILNINSENLRVPGIVPGNHLRDKNIYLLKRERVKRERVNKKCRNTFVAGTRQSLVQNFQGKNQNSWNTQPNRTSEYFWSRLAILYIFIRMYFL